MSFARDPQEAQSHASVLAMSYRACAEKCKRLVDSSKCLVGATRRQENQLLDARLKSETLNGQMDAVHLQLDAKGTVWHQLQMQLRDLEQAKAIVELEAQELQRQRSHLTTKVCSFISHHRLCT